MSEALKAVPGSDKIDTGITGVVAIAKGLSEALSDSYRLLFKTHAVHWNVEGPMFHSIHVLTEAQYNNLFKAADDLAERIRALGRIAPFQLSEITKQSCVTDPAKLGSAQDMVEDLASDHEAVVRRMREVIGKAEDGDDVATADLLTARCAFHEKAAWMLRATAK
ncbi:MAG: DNA starvation/stationary phase protection protein [Cypionkella sp.]|jgi:starvation-inducible DNA-binding protein|nr:DNA starvation/stationary phase protection protein [Cypionkella sp.]